jgi:hypothetical protein
LEHTQRKNKLQTESAAVCFLVRASLGIIFFVFCVLECVLFLTHNQMRLVGIVIRIFGVLRLLNQLSLDPKKSATDAVFKLNLALNPCNKKQRENTPKLNFQQLIFLFKREARKTTTKYV